MTTKSNSKKNLSEHEIDRVVEVQANDDSAWEKPVRVRRTGPASLSIPVDLASRAAFLAQLHHAKSVDLWLTRIIQERIEMEEAAFVGVKRELAAKTAHFSLRTFSRTASAVLELG